jgi:flavin reductase (DIM6/NTAB) family NADH-FMN oxidoreductase RutF
MLKPVELRHAYLLMNHGPVTLITSQHEHRANVMAAAWAMPLDFLPAKVLVVIDKKTLTRQLVERSGHLAINLPTRHIAAATLAVGHHSACEEADAGFDKFAAFGLERVASPLLGVPFVQGCAAWLECKVIAEPHNETVYDLFIAEVLGAYADEQYFKDGRWQTSHNMPQPATLHYTAGKHFFESAGLFEVTQAEKQAVQSKTP